MLIGCGLVLPTNPDELLGVLSYVVLVPEKSCEDLKDEFQLDSLTPVNGPADLGLTHEEVFLGNLTGEVVRVWYFPAADERGIVVSSAGSVGAMECHLYLPKLLTERGWSVVMYDYQGFGESTGTASLDSLVGDLSVVLDWTLQRTGTEEVSFYSLSVGSIPAVALAVQRPGLVNGVILDSPTSLANEIERFDPLIFGGADWVVARLDAELRTEALIEDMWQPLLVFSNGHDIVTPAAMVRGLYELAPGEKDLVHFPNAEHGLAIYLETQPFIDRVDVFLRERWD